MFVFEGKLCLNLPDPHRWKRKSSAWKRKPKRGLPLAARRSAKAFAFRKHAFAARVLLLIHDGQVYDLASFLLRWKCGACGTTFRHYPAGVRPYKQYVVVTLFVFCQRYLKETSATYRMVVKPAGMPIRYAGEAAEIRCTEAEKEREETRALSHSTLWRWMGFVASLWALARQRSERQQTRADYCDLSAWRIHPHKYRSQKRHQILIRAAQVLSVFFDKKYTTDLGTLYGGP